MARGVKVLRVPDSIFVYKAPCLACAESVDVVMENRVFIAKCGSYGNADVSEAVGRIFEWCGGVDFLLSRGKKILIKPNLLMAREPEGATTTHPAVVAEVASRLVSAGASVTIADSPGGAFGERELERVYSACGMTGAAERSGATLNRDFSSQRVDAEYGGVKRSFDVISAALEADAIICIAKMKTHMLAHFTGAVKNMYGVMAGYNKSVMHARHPSADRFCAMVVDLCCAVTPIFSFIDGVEGMDGKGPSGGRVRQANVIIASRSPYAADLAAMDYCGLDWKRAPVHKAAVKGGLVCATPIELEMSGECGMKLAPPFAPPMQSAFPWNLLTKMPVKFGRAKVQPLPVFTQKCVGCGDCAAVCPQKAIRIENRRAHLDAEKCIRCYCCHELCPCKAVEV